jgi:hypothetical protein
MAAIAAATGVSSFNGRGGAVTLTAADVSGVGAAMLAGSTFTGTVGINVGSSNAITINKPSAAAGNNLIVGASAGLSRWSMTLGNSSAESGSNAGSDLSISRFNDAGTLIDAPFNIYRNTGLVVLNDALQVGGSSDLTGIVIGYNNILSASANVNVQPALGCYSQGRNTCYGMWNSTAATTLGFGTMDGYGVPVAAWATMTPSGFTYSGSINSSSIVTSGNITANGTATFNGNISANSGITSGGTVTIKPATGDPQLNLAFGGVTNSFINDNGGSFNFYSNAAGTTGLYIARGANAWTTISDARLPYKKTARRLNTLDRLAHVQLYENEVDGRLELFAKAQEIYRDFPHLVKQGSGDESYVPTGMSDEKAWGLSYERIGIVALQGVKELLARITALEAKLNALENIGRTA